MCVHNTTLHLTLRMSTTLATHQERTFVERVCGFVGSRHTSVQLQHYRDLLLLGLHFLVVFTLSSLCLGWTTIPWYRSGCLATLVLLAASAAMAEDLRHPLSVLVICGDGISTQDIISSLKTLLEKEKSSV